MTKRLPQWLKTNTFDNLHDTKRLLRGHKLATVCEEARCPNRGYCFSKPTATFMILGDRCTRNCGFCSVGHGTPGPTDPQEPERVALAALSMKLTHVVVTSVTRDDLPDGGAGHFAATVAALRKHLPASTVEVLTPDFKGRREALATVINAKPDVFNHNVETVASLYHKVRPQANYRMSLEILKTAKELSPSLKVKSGIMVGLGETFDEVIEVFADLREAGCNFLTVGQYLRPGKENLPVADYIHPDVFAAYKEKALAMGFDFAACAPLVRSSMNAQEMLENR